MSPLYLTGRAAGGNPADDTIIHMPGALGVASGGKGGEPYLSQFSIFF